MVGLKEILHWPIHPLVHMLESDHGGIESNPISINARGVLIGLESDHGGIESIYSYELRYAYFLVRIRPWWDWKILVASFLIPFNFVRIRPWWDWKESPGQLLFICIPPVRIRPWWDWKTLQKQMKEVKERWLESDHGGIEREKYHLGFASSVYG